MTHFSSYADRLRAGPLKEQSVVFPNKIDAVSDESSSQPSSNYVTHNISKSSDIHYRHLRDHILGDGANVNQSNSSFVLTSDAETSESLTGYRDKVGQTFSFMITGNSQGSIWGTDIYTDDSHLAVAAVHAGAVKTGETKSVTVKILPGELSYQASICNDIISSSYGAWEGSYSFVGVPITAAIIIPDLQTYRDKVGQSFSFMITGSIQGSVWGTDIYTDDSNVAVAAVHAGVVENGETKMIGIKILPGRSIYQGTTQNGITSAWYDIWEGSYSFITSTTNIATDESPLVLNTHEQ
ncbi:unnamed protein product [Adineta steineri]|uniref:LCCL domain-containing protein n=1 Tax=Adineta steineri TaxID=433720 RepID=A0A820FB94_9BILA|nr:unnamed protein product [Adineta steineri]CAF4258532.1 unnamed protein product [Adineta steineri]